MKIRMTLQDYERLNYAYSLRIGADNERERGRHARKRAISHLLRFEVIVALHALLDMYLRYSVARDVEKEARDIERMLLFIYTGETGLPGEGAYQTLKVFIIASLISATVVVGLLLVYAWRVGLY